MHLTCKVLHNKSFSCILYLMASCAVNYKDQAALYKLLVMIRRRVLIRHRVSYGGMIGSDSTATCCMGGTTRR